MAHHLKMIGKGLGLVLAGVVFLAGCDARLVAERDALFEQNVELQDRLTAAQSDLARANAERNDLLDRLEAAQQRPAPAQVAARPGQQAVPVTPGAAGFGGIEGVETTSGPGQITVRVAGDVLFASGQAQVRSQAQQTLDQIASVIQREYPDQKIRVIGYTDTDPIRRSQWEDNLALSQARAAAVFRYLQEKGIDPERMEAVGRGEWHPEATKARSRRVEIVVAQ